MQASDELARLDWRLHDQSSDPKPDRTQTPQPSQCGSLTFFLRTLACFAHLPIYCPTFLVTCRYQWFHSILLFNSDTEKVMTVTTTEFVALQLLELKHMAGPNFNRAPCRCLRAPSSGQCSTAAAIGG